MKAPKAAVARVQEALGCWLVSAFSDERPGHRCGLCGVDWTDRGCTLAVAAADAAVAPIAAQTLRDAADAWQSGEGFTVMSPRGVGIPAIDYAQRTLDWLRARVDRIEADQ